MMIDYYKEMDVRGYFEPNEKKWLKQGCLFSTIKQNIFGMKPDEIELRENLIKSG